MSVLLVILVLSLLVVIHELGHLLAALRSKVGVDEFGVGYPPLAKKLFTWKNIPFTLNWIPFGGFVKLQGEDAEPDTQPKPGDFKTASRSKRAAIIIAGVLVNFLFGVVIFSAIYTIIGIPVAVRGAVIEDVQPGSPAEEARLPKNVKITSVRTDNEIVATDTVKSVIDTIQSNRGNTITLVTTGPCEQLNCVEQSQEFKVYVRTAEETAPGEGAVGILFQEQIMVRYPLWQMPIRGAMHGTMQALELGKQIVISLGMLLHDLVTAGKVPTDIAGPIGIAAQAQSAKLAEQGLLIAILFTASLSINLAVMNILPIPPLDGGRLFFLLLEPFVPKKQLEKAEYWANYSGFVILMVLIVLISIRDIWQIVT